MNADSWFLLQSGPCASAENMAVDEALLDRISKLDHPILRFYSWTEPAATFGYFQKYADVAALTLLRPLIRRPTGGGLVPHDADWTYSLVFPPGHEWYALKAVASYRRLHEWLQTAFDFVGIKTNLAPVRHPAAPGQCFIGAEQHDLLWQGRKIAGAAQRRNRLGLLIQGSVQPPPGMQREHWEQAMRDSAEQQWNVTWRPLSPDVDFLEHVSLLVQSKYARPEHNQRR